MEQYPLLAMRNISKSFPGVKALDNLNFDLRSGEVHGILGENGAGKSTLIKVLGGIYHPEQGEILINGQKVSIQSVMAAKAQGISIIHQELMLVPHMTVAENIYLTREPKTHSGRIDKAKMNADAQTILDGLGTQIRADTLVGRLSIAQQQQVEIAKALSMNAKILVMDEPTSSLTESEVGVLFQIMRRLRQQGVGIIYISHRMAELFEITDRITVIRDGRFIGTCVTSETDADSLIAMMVGAKLESFYTFTKRTFGEVALEVKNIRRPERAGIAGRRRGPAGLRFGGVPLRGAKGNRAWHHGCGGHHGSGLSVRRPAGARRCPASAAVCGSRQRDRLFRGAGRKRYRGSDSQTHTDARTRIGEKQILKLL